MLCPCVSLRSWKLGRLVGVSATAATATATAKVWNAWQIASDLGLHQNRWPHAEEGALFCVHLSVIHGLVTCSATPLQNNIGGEARVG